MARLASGAKEAEGPALDDQCDTPLAPSLSEGLGVGVAPFSVSFSVCLTQSVKTLLDPESTVSRQLLHF